MMLLIIVLRCDGETLKNSLFIGETFCLYSVYMLSIFRKCRKLTRTSCFIDWASMHKNMDRYLLFPITYLFL